MGTSTAYRIGGDSIIVPMQWVFIFFGLMILQDTVTLFINHRLFAASSLCTDINQRLSGGKFAEDHCYEHEQYAYNGFSIRHCKLLLQSHITPQSL